MKVSKPYFAGPNSDAPEGVFGVTDVEAPAPKPRAITPSTEPKSDFKLRSKSSFANDIAPQLNVVDEDVSDLVDKVGVENIENALKVPREQLLQVVRRAKRRAKRLSASMLDSAVHAMALDTALTYVTTAVRDGIGMELEHDPSVELIYSDIALLEITLDRVRQMKAPAQVKRYYLKVFIDKLADDTSLRIREARSKTNAMAKVRAMQGIVSRMSDAKNSKPDTPSRDAPDRETTVDERQRSGSGRASMRRKTKRRV